MHLLEVDNLHTHFIAHDRMRRVRTARALNGVGFNLARAIGVKTTAPCSPVHSAGCQMSNSSLRWRSVRDNASAASLK